MMNMVFKDFKIAVNDQFDRMISLSDELFYVDVGRELHQKKYVSKWISSTDGDRWQYITLCL